jgi:hypothetical protein
MRSNQVMNPTSVSAGSSCQFRKAVFGTPILCRGGRNTCAILLLIMTAGCDGLVAQSNTSVTSTALGATSVAHQSRSAVRPHKQAPAREFDLQIAARQSLRGLGHIDGDTLQLALPVLPEDPRPADLKSRAGETTRVITLKRKGPVVDRVNKIMGTWTVLSSFQAAEASQQFLGDTLVFGETLLEITETASNDDPYKVPYHFGHVTQPIATAVAEQTAAIDALRENFNADIELNKQGEALHLTLCGISKDGTKRDFNDTIVTQIACLTTVEHLVLTDWMTGMTPQRLAFLKNLKRLTKLDIRKTNITDEALVHLSDLPELEILKLEFNDQLTDAAATHLQKLTRLTELDLAFVNITDAAIKPISRLMKLQNLYLYGTTLTDTGVTHLARLKNLKILYLGSEDGQHVTDESVPVLKELKSLELLGLYGTEISVSQTNRLKEALPACDVLAPSHPQQSAQTASLPEAVSNGTAEAMLTVDGQNYAMKYALTYPVRINNKPMTAVLITAEPPSSDELAACLKRHGNDFTFAPFLTQIRLYFDRHGKLQDYHVYADKFTINGSGTDLDSDCTLLPQQDIQGIVRTHTGLTYDRIPYRFEAVFQINWN